ncbi:hypothetical protein ABT354_16745 [Streptomyces sp. NPDC000594]|uniref:hypothetical protein n=1 Tax=Streptomyces sp. NPDC000594 TaxID=3154261 RepID=UPI00331AB4EB
MPQHAPQTRPGRAAGAAAVLAGLLLTGGSMADRAVAAPGRDGPVPVADTPGAERVKYYVVLEQPSGEPEFLFGIARRTLGDGNRFQEIFELNQGRRQPDGRAMDGTTDVPAGWILRLPPDAAGPEVRFGVLPARVADAVPPGVPAPSDPGAVATAPPGGSYSALTLTAAVGGALALGAGTATLVLRRRHRLGGTPAAGAVPRDPARRSGTGRHGEVSTPESVTAPGDGGGEDDDGHGTGESPGAGGPSRPVVAAVPAYAHTGTARAARPATVAPGAPEPGAREAEVREAGAREAGTQHAGMPGAPTGRRPRTPPPARRAPQPVAPASPVSVVFGDDLVDIAFGHTDPSGNGSLAWTAAPYEPPAGGTAFVCVGSGERGCLFLDLARTPGVVSVTGDRPAVLRLLESLALQLADGTAPVPVRAFALGPAGSSDTFAGLEVLTSPNEAATRLGEPGTAALVVLFAAPSGPADLAAVQTTASAVPDPVVVVLLGDTERTAWRLTVRESAAAGV